MTNYSHLTRCSWISLNTSWSSSILASHLEPINALELSKYWELNHKLTIKFLKVLLRSLFEAYCRSLRCQRKLLLLVFSFKKHNITAKIYINCYFCWKAFINYAKFICMKSYGKISCFSTEGKMVFSSFSKRYFIFLPFKRDTTIINSFSLYRCKNLLRYYRSFSIWWISYNFQIYLTLYLMLVSVKRF